MKQKLFSKKTKNKDQIKFLLEFPSKENFAAADGSIKGVAIPYEQETNDWRNMSFAKGSIKNLSKVSLFVNHDSWDVMSMVGVSEFKDSPKSLNFEARLNMKDPDVMNKIIPLIEMDALKGVSVGAMILKRELVFDDEGFPDKVIITEAEIYELSLVTFQAFEDAKIEAQKEKDMKIENGVEVQETETELNEEAQAPQSPEGEVADNGEEVETEEVEDGSEETEESSEVVEENDNEDGAEEVESESEVAPTEEVASQEVQETIELTQDQIIEQLQRENLELKKIKTNDDKAASFKRLLESGTVCAAQKDRIMKTFDTAKSMDEFYEGIPASFTVTPKGEGQKDVTSDQISSELHKNLAKQSSFLSEEDYEKYSK